MICLSSGKYTASVLLLSIALLAACGGSTGESANNTESPANVNTEATPQANSESNAGAENASAEPTAEANVNGVTKTEQGDEIRTERVSFAKGASSATLKGSVAGYNVVDYVVNAQKGQTMSISLKTSSTFAYFNVRGSKDGFASELDVNPKAMEEKDWKAELPKSGDYYIRVYLVRAEARRDGKADYSLSISVTGGGTKETAASEKPVFYDCPDRMEVVATLKSGGDWVEVEIGDTVLRLNRVQSGSGSKFADRGEKNVFWLKGKEALLEYRGKSYTCSERV